MHDNLTTRPDPMFHLQVRRVCKPCNGGWMDRLDHDVERWVVGPDEANEVCDPTTFRRWAIKIAIMRSLVDNAIALPPNDFPTLFAGEDVEGWHVFAGKSDFLEWRHNYACFGGGLNEVGYLSHGVVHVSWVLGASVVSTIRVAGEDTGAYFLKAFREYNTMQWGPLVEIPYGADAFPSFSGHRELRLGEAEPFFKFFTPEPVSPIAGQIRAGYAQMGAATKPPAP